MTSYSHSRLGTFQQCRYKYKLQYIDKIKVKTQTTIEAFMGNRVHEALEKLYKGLKYRKLDSKEYLISFFEDSWEKTWNEDILIAKKEYSKENYRDMGRKFISDYYDHYKPFDSLKTLGLETKDRLELENGNQYHVRIDRLACDSDGNYYVCDYKTNNKLKAQGELDEDRQLAMYSLWVKKNFKDCRNVKLAWYFLAFDREMVSERSDAQLQQLKLDTESLIKEVESCVDFPTNVTALCDWCVFKPMCPAWKHEFELKEKTPETLREDDGVKLVDELSEIDLKETEMKKRKEEIKDGLIAFARQKEVDVVFGSDKKASVKPYGKPVYPEDREAFVRLLKDKGLYEDLSTLSYPKLNSAIQKKQIDKEVLAQTSTETDYRISLSKKKQPEN